MKILLVARPDIKTLEDLRGKRFGVTRIGTGFWIHAMLASEHLGLEPKRDRISFVEVGGGEPRMVQALEAGEFDAPMLGPAQSSQLTSKGFSMLLDMYSANISGVQSALVVAGAYLRERPEVVEKVVSAFVEGIAFSLSSPNKEIVLISCEPQTLRVGRSDAKHAAGDGASRSQGAEPEGRRSGRGQLRPQAR